MTSDTLALDIRDLSKTYGDYRALHRLNLSLRAGEVFGFLGPNGAGKTTTLKMLTGLLKPTSGTIHIYGRSMLDTPLEAKRFIGFIPDRPYVYEKLTAVEFMRFVGALHSMSKRDTARRIEELLSLFGLAAWGASLIENFSHGMKQRLVVASALLPRPRLLVVDEPMVGLDPKGALLIKEIFRRICADAGVTVFLSTHSLDVAEEVCDRVAIINHGEVVTMGTVDDLRAEAGLEGSRLEEVFLTLTAEDEDASSVLNPVIEDQVTR